MDNWERVGHEDWSARNMSLWGDMNRDYTKKVALGLGALKNSIRHKLAGTTTSMISKYRYCASTDNGGTRHNISLNVFIQSVEKGKAHKAKEAAKWTVKLASAFGGAASGMDVSELSDLGSGISDASGFEGVDRSGLSKAINQQAFRHLKKSDPWRAAMTQPILGITLMHFVWRPPVFNHPGQGGIDNDNRVFLFYNAWDKNGIISSRNMYKARKHNNFRNSIGGATVYRMHRAQHVPQQKMGNYSWQVPDDYLYGNNNNNNNNNNMNVMPQWAMIR